MKNFRISRVVCLFIVLESFLRLKIIGAFWRHFFGSKLTYSFEDCVMGFKKTRGTLAALAYNLRKNGLSWNRPFLPIFEKILLSQVFSWTKNRPSTNDSRKCSPMLALKNKSKNPCSNNTFCIKKLDFLKKTTFLQKNKFPENHVFRPLTQKWTSNSCFSHKKTGIYHLPNMRIENHIICHFRKHMCSYMGVVTDFKDLHGY